MYEFEVKDDGIYIVKSGDPLGSARIEGYPQLVMTKEAFTEAAGAFMPKKAVYVEELEASAKIYTDTAMTKEATEAEARAAELIKDLNSEIEYKAMAYESIEDGYKVYVMGLDGTAVAIGEIPEEPEPEE